MSEYDFQSNLGFIASLTGVFLLAKAAIRLFSMLRFKLKFRRLAWFEKLAGPVNALHGTQLDWRRQAALEVLAGRRLSFEEYEEVFALANSQKFSIFEIQLMAKYARGKSLLSEKPPLFAFVDLVLGGMAFLFGVFLFLISVFKMNGRIDLSFFIMTVGLVVSILVFPSFRDGASYLLLSKGRKARISSYLEGAKDKPFF